MSLFFPASVFDQDGRPSDRQDISNPPTPPPQPPGAQADPGLRLLLLLSHFVTLLHHNHRPFITGSCPPPLGAFLAGKPPRRCPRRPALCLAPGCGAIHAGTRGSPSVASATDSWAQVVVSRSLGPSRAPRSARGRLVSLCPSPAHTRSLIRNRLLLKPTPHSLPLLFRGRGSGVPCSAWVNTPGPGPRVRTAPTPLQRLQAAPAPTPRHGPLRPRGSPSPVSRVRDESQLAASAAGGGASVRSPPPGAPRPDSSPPVCGFSSC